MSGSAAGTPVYLCARTSATGLNEAQAFFDIIYKQMMEAMAQSDTMIVLGDHSAVPCRSQRLLYVRLRENGNT